MATKLNIQNLVTATWKCPKCDRFGVTHSYATAAEAEKAAERQHREQSPECGRYAGEGVA